MKELICIVCPNGCRLHVDEKNGYAVTGNRCARGEEYGKAECTHPTRVLTSTVAIGGAVHRRCPVKTARAIPKEALFAVMHELDGVHLTAPVHVGDVVLADAAGTGCPVVAAKTMEAL